MAYTGPAPSPLKWIFGIGAFMTALIFSHFFPFWITIIFALGLAGIHVYLAATRRSPEEETGEPTPSMPAEQPLPVQAPALDLDPLKRSMIQVSDQVATTVGIVCEISANMLGDTDTLEASSQRLEELAATGNTMAAQAHEAKSGIADVVSEIAVASGGAQQLDEAMRAISTATEQISGMVDVISDIASMTNLLALNAAIEAAHAGTAGRGFAVVADEVKRLSQNVDASTKNVTAIIKTTNSTVAEGMRIAQTVIQSATKLASRSNNVSRSVDSLVTAVAEQSQNLSYVAEKLTKECGSMHESINSISEAVIATAEAADEACGIADGL
ncbi:MAG: methyl-accepting chemotaxis protein [Oryzomonas sp.]|uniref:methyl-accepting chemotaxis protein n=1 Tax=Oryzomonas sp. TaxID=2855186 RepID=UPI00283C62CE|nr:methyl-accepting chemotaxis protein [Oryzomonas sp.]MDR3580594.1 methyl-accepting chemotaxis protein [Oryzomonas sp.]